MRRLSETASPHSRVSRKDRGKTVIAGRAAQSPPVAAARPAAARLVLVGLGISVVPLDSSVNIAFPDITGSFGLPIPMIQWVIICYVLTHAGLMLAFGRVGDMWGHGRVFRAGLAWSVGAFVLCAAAPSFGWLLFFRFLQGIGAGLIISCAPALVTSLYPEARRSQALGMFTLMYALGSAVGPLLGGALVAQWGWPGVFWFRAPIALTTLLLLRGLPRQGGAVGEQRFDIIGAVLLASGLVSLLLALNRLPRLADGDNLGMLLLPSAIVVLALFVRWEARAVQPVIQVRLFRSRPFAVVNLASMLMYLATFSIMLIGPYFLVPRLGVLQGGLVLAAGFVAMAATSPLAGVVLPRLGAGRAAPLGALLTGIGLFSVGSWQNDTPALAMAASLGLHGVGLGLFQVAYMELVMAASPLAHRGVAGSLSMLTRTVGTVTAATLLTLGIQAIQSSARAGGLDEAQAFLTAFHAMFHIVGAAALLIGALVALAARR
jgi:MFS family permease